jgi:hypothetical protein
MEYLFLALLTSNLRIGQLKLSDRSGAGEKNS